MDDYKVYIMTSLFLSDDTLNMLQYPTVSNGLLTRQDDIMDFIEKLMLECQKLRRSKKFREILDRLIIIRESIISDGNFYHVKHDSKNGEIYIHPLCVLKNPKVAL